MPPLQYYLPFLNQPALDRGGLPLYCICMMSHVELSDAVALHQALADPVRLLLVRLLLERELCVCELVEALEEPQYKVSRHLGILKRAGLVRDRREGTWMHYEIHPNLPPVWRAALDALRAAWDTSDAVQTALTRLRQCATRPPGASACDGG